MTITRCPTCNARRKGARRCRRCKTDLTKTLEIAEQAEKQFHLAMEALSAGCIGVMRHHAERSFSLRRTPSSERLLACSALLCGDYKLALTLWGGSRSSKAKTKK